MDRIYRINRTKPGRIDDSDRPNPVNRVNPLYVSSACEPPVRPAPSIPPANQSGCHKSKQSATEQSSDETHHSASKPRPATEKPGTSDCEGPLSMKSGRRARPAR